MSDTPSLGARWVAACRRAGVEPWAAGMLVAGDGRVLHARGAIVVTDEVSADYGGHVERESAGLVPDLSDSATLGAALGVLREAMSLPFIQLSPKLRLTPDRAGWALASGWVCYLNDRDERWFVGPTEAEAIVAAAEALAAGGGR